MNLEITIKVPLGQAVSVSEQIQQDGGSEHVPPTVAELSNPQASSMSWESPPPPSAAELGLNLETEASQQEATAEAPPPSLSELGVVDSGPIAEHAPPSLQMLEPGDTPDFSPPAPEMLGTESDADTMDVAPPSIEELQMAMGGQVEKPEAASQARKKRSSRAKAK